MLFNCLIIIYFLELRAQQKNLIQYKDIIKRPLSDKQKSLTRSNSKQGRQLISIQERPFSASRSERTLHETGFIKNSRFTHEIRHSSSEDSNGFCYFKKHNNNNDVN